MNNFGKTSLYHRTISRFYLHHGYTRKIRDFSMISYPILLRRHSTPVERSAISCPYVVQLEKRNLSTVANDAVTAVSPIQSPFTGIWLTLSQSTPVAYMQDAITSIHELTGLPWWASIVVSTILFRTVITLPLAIYQYKIMARLELLALEMPAIIAELKKEAAIAMKKFNWTQQHTKYVFNRSLKKQWNALIVRDNCHPAKTFIVIWGQIPLWICQSMALRNLVHLMPDPTSLQAQIVYTEMTVGGFGWIPNLTEVDSSYILPVALGLINLGIVELQTALRNRSTTRLQKYSTNLFRTLSVAMIPVSCLVPSALCVYWVASSTYGLAQNLLLSSPSVRRSFGIPQTKSEIENPYKRIWEKMKAVTEKSEVTSTKESTNAWKKDPKTK